MSHRRRIVAEKAEGIPVQRPSITKQNWKAKNYKEEMNSVKTHASKRKFI